MCNFCTMQYRFVLCDCQMRTRDRIQSNKRNNAIETQDEINLRGKAKCHDF